MSDERIMILEMLEEGKITTEEALKLLDAIGEKDEEYNYYNHNTSRSNGDLASKIVSGIENAFNKVSSAFSNIEFSTEFFDNQSGRTTKSIRIDNIDDYINLYINNRNDIVEIYQWDNTYVEAIANISYNEKEYNRDYDFIIQKNKDNNYYIGIDTNKSNKGFSAKMIVRLPKNLIKNLKVETTNSRIEADGIEVYDINLITTNARIYISSVKANNIICSTRNSKIISHDIEANNLDLNTTNSKIILNGIGVDSVKANTTNSTITCDVIRDNVKNLDLNTTNGGIYINGLNYSRPIKATVTKYLSHNISPHFINTRIDDNNLILTNTLDFDDKDDILNIFAHTSNGKIEIM